jgi:tight adherence protein B
MAASIAVYLLVTVLLLGLSQGVLRYWERDRLKVLQRLGEEFGPGPATTGMARALFKDPEALALTTAAEEYAYFSKDAGGAAPAPARPFRTKCAALLQRAAVSLTVNQWLLIPGSCAAALTVLGAWFGWIGALAGLIAGAAGPWLVLVWRAASRQQTFLRQLPNAFELMARVIRTGQAVPQAFQAVAEAFEDPLASEFAFCQHQQNFGLRPEVAFREMAQRSGILELRIFVMGMGIQRQTGGNLAEALERLASLVRARLRLRQQIRVLTAEGRLQGLTLVILPFVVFGALFFVNRQYADLLLARPGLLAATLACMGLGVLWIRRIVRFEG